MLAHRFRRVRRDRAIRDTVTMAADSNRFRVSRCDDRAFYELHDGDELLSFAPFSEHDGIVTIPHVETRVEHRGNGYSSVLMDGVVEDLRTRGVGVCATCSVARAYIVEHAPELLVS